jgi:ribonuclease BN (tRNA processing enzyme)
VPNLRAFGYRVTTPDGVIAYSGDTVMCPPLVPLADGADVFVVECSCWGEQCGPHLNPKNILELRERISPRTKFILTHIGGGETPQALLDAGILVADDLRSYQV